MSVQAPPNRLLNEWNWLFREFATRLLWAAQIAPDAKVTSWFRDEISNRAAGGHPFSQHRLGLAVDLVSQWDSEIANRVRTAGLVPVLEGSHLHVQAFPAGTIPEHLFVY